MKISNQSKRLIEAAKTLEEIQKEIEPFRKPIKIEMPKTQGQWKTSSGNFEPEVIRNIFPQTFINPWIPKNPTNEK